MKDYIKEEITTYRELLKIFIFIEIALFGSLLNIGIDILLDKYPFFMVIFDIINLIANIVLLFIIKLLWNKLYEFKKILKDLG